MNKTLFFVSSVWRLNCKSPAAVAAQSREWSKPAWHSVVCGPALIPLSPSVVTSWPWTWWWPMCGAWAPQLGSSWLSVQSHLVFQCLLCCFFVKLLPSNLSSCRSHNKPHISACVCNALLLLACVPSCVCVCRGQVTGKNVCFESSRSQFYLLLCGIG